MTDITLWTQVVKLTNIHKHKNLRLYQTGLFPFPWLYMELQRSSLYPQVESRIFLKIL